MIRKQLAPFEDAYVQAIARHGAPILGRNPRLPTNHTRSVICAVPGKMAAQKHHPSKSLCSRDWRHRPTNFLAADFAKNLSLADL
jgi:hypothetical protein